ncbi:ROK family protein [Microlunatus parietis]|uniref:Glucokinase n=1 Tax=Microlunatus parietis TaxID=682979 RepID=A0A7Y9I4G2_9ACTN|nr:ROK family protein [Microlunatus parietis]NYE69908.1 glucokinase [Microlunatus parietis]
MTEQVLAIDVGGTKIAAALVDDEGRIGRETVQPTAESADPDEVFAGLEAAVRELVGTETSGAPLRVGIGSAGPIDEPAGTVSPVNIGAWRDFPIVSRTRAVIKELTGTEPLVGLAGDGHCFALGEHWLGAGRDLDSIIGVVVSTGVGGGAVLRDRLVGGLTGNAVHLGHITVDAWGGRCVCGGYGCVELYARGPGMVAAARQAGWTGGDDARALTESARAGDPTAISVIDRGMRALAAGLATTATELDIPTVVLGGGVAKAGDVIFEPLRRHLRDFAVLPYVTGLEVRPAVLDNAGLLGAAALAFTLPQTR